MTAFYDFNNIIEDGYIEEMLMKSFKGDFVASLYELRDFQYEEFSTIERAMKDGRSNFSIWHLMMLSYAKFGLIKVQDNSTFTEPLVKKFCNFLPSITDCVTEDNSYARLDKSLTLYIDMWDVVKENLVNITDEAYEKMVKTLENLADSMGAANQRGQAMNISQKSDSSENSLNRQITQLLAQSTNSGSEEETSSSSTGEQGSEQDGKAKATDSSSGNESESDNSDATEGTSASSTSEQGSEQDGKAKAADSSSGNESKNDLSDNVTDYDSILKTLSKELKEVKAGKEEDMQKAEQKAEQDILATKQNVAQDRVTEQARREARQNDEQIINNAIMDGPHARVTYRLHDYSPASYKDAYITMNNTYSLEYIGKKMANKVKPIFEKKIKGAVYHGQHCGSRISIPYYQKDSSKPFDRIKKPEKISLSCTVIIDQSGSMYGYKLKSALRAAAIIKTFCNELEIPTMVFGHSSSYPTMDIYRFCEFDGSENEIYTLAAGDAHCGTRDGAALLYAVNKLKQRREEKKIIFIISDGSPCDYGYSGATAYADIQGIIKSASAYGISFFAAAIDEDKESIAKIYGEDRFVDISNLDDLPSKMAYVLKRALKIR